MTLTIQLSDEYVTALQAKAAAEGLSLEAWVQKIAEQDLTVDRPMQTAADIILSRMRNIPPEIMASMPKDGASQHDHYIYGWPKKEA
jgi:plasmid stability protein